MAAYDIFNGDADGITALIQLRLSEPQNAKLITGIKRDIKLLDRIRPEKGDQLTVLDISMAKNQLSLVKTLETGCQVFYADHHQPGDIPRHPNLQALINPSANTCTALIIDRHLGGKFREWAITGAYGDNLIGVAEALCKKQALSETDRDSLHQLGTYLNYNSYGLSEDDLLLHPAELYQKLAGFCSPLDFIHQQPELFDQLKTRYRQDMAHSEALTCHWQNKTGRVFILPRESWARRVTGVLANQLANQAPHQAHAVLTPLEPSGWQVSIRAPLERRVGADILATRFETGGGRKAAAGINHLPESELEGFITDFSHHFSAQ